MSCTLWDAEDLARAVLWSERQGSPPDYVETERLMQRKYGIDLPTYLLIVRDLLRALQPEEYPARDPGERE